MKLTEEQETNCTAFREMRGGMVHCAECPMVLSVRDCICLKNVTEQDAKENWDWDGSQYPALAEKERTHETEH